MSPHQPVRILLSVVLVFFTACLGAAAAQSPGPFVTVSAASYIGTVTPDSIVAGFGANLSASSGSATTIPLPATLAGVGVFVQDSAGQERAAGLFFVSAGQINYHVPPLSATGMATVRVRAGATVVAQGTVEIANVAPAIFTADSSGTGAPAGLIFRLRPDNTFVYESLWEVRNGLVLPRPVNFTPNGDRLFLVLFLSGIRRAAAGTAQVILGGNTLTPDAVSGLSEFVGLDQVNAEIPAGLTGQLSLAITVTGFTSFNLTNIELYSTQQSSGPGISGLSSSLVTAGDQLTINGSGFSTTPESNEVYVLDSEQTALPAQVLSATSNQIQARVPFGAGTGQVRLGRTSAAGTTANLSLRTSVSGFVETIDRQPLAGIKVKIAGTTKQTTTTATGSFVIPDATEGALLMEFDGSTISNPPYPQVTLKQAVRASRDNQMLPVRVAQSTGTTIPVGSSGPAAATGGLGTESAGGSISVSSPEDTNAINAASLSLDVPLGAKVVFPGGATTGVLTLTAIDGSRAPVDLPAGQFSSTIAQITPLGVRISPGAKLTFPNNDGLAPNAVVTLYRLDLTRGSATVGEFIRAGDATVSADGSMVTTAAGAITESSYYFVSTKRSTAAVYGHVIEADGRPVRRAIVQTRGQSTFTDSNGGYVLRNIPVLKTNDQATLDISFMRPDQTVDRVERKAVLLNASNLTLVEPDIALPAKTGNRAPLLLVPGKLFMAVDEKRDFDFAAGDPDAGQSVQISLAGASARLATVASLGGESYRLSLGSFTATGTYNLDVTATDTNGAKTTQVIVVTVGRKGSLPYANAQSVTTTEDLAKAMTLTGTDPGGKQLTYTIVGVPARGDLKGTAPNLTYTPDRDFSGIDSFTFRVNNGVADSAPATVYVVVIPVNDAPTLNVPGPQFVNGGQTLSLAISATDPDVGQTLNITATGLPQGATFTTVSGTSKQLVWAPTFVQAGAYTVMFNVSDNGNPALSSQKTMVITSRASFAKTAGPQGGEINCLYELTQNVKNNVPTVMLFAGTQGAGIFRSSDYGKTWGVANRGLDENGLRVNNFLFAGGVLYAATNSGVYKSTDTGLSWSTFNANTTVDNPTFLGVARALATNGASLFVATSRGVFRLNSTTQKWELVNTGLTNIPIWSLLFHNGTLFAGGYDKVYRFNATTLAWTATGAGPTSNSLAGIPLLSDGTTLYAGAVNGLYKTIDNGVAWTTAGTGFPANTQAFALAKTAAATPVLFAGTNGSGVYRSLDSGRTWSATSTGLTSSGAIVQSLLNFGIYALSGLTNTRTDAMLAGTYDSV
ncbi:MAG: Ig-like domain-containing protein, partial [Blastocatellia bacterium]